MAKSSQVLTSLGQMQLAWRKVEAQQQNNPLSFLPGSWKTKTGKNIFSSGKISSHSSDASKDTVPPAPSMRAFSVGKSGLGSALSRLQKPSGPFESLVDFGRAKVRKINGQIQWLDFPKTTISKNVKCVPTTTRIPV